MTLQIEQYVPAAEKYAPAMDALERWPHWRVQLADLDDGGEICDPAARLFAIAPTPTPQRAVAHAVAHLDLGHHLKPGSFSDGDCDDADQLASERFGGQPWADVQHDAPRREHILQRPALCLLALLLIVIVGRTIAKGLEVLAVAAL